MEYDIVVVGGGVAGLYCSWKLSRRSRTHTVGLFEGSNRFGGRIETVMFGTFPAEFGPMRFEEPGQRKLMELFQNLGLETIRFPEYQAERPDYPVYELKDDERGPPPFNKRYTTLDLLKLGIIRILKGTYWRSPGDPNNPRDPNHESWLGDFTEDDYAAMRQEAKQGNEYLYDLGLWNALSGVLSHQALMKIRDLGTFYHLIPENPNAIEWIIFWLRGLNPKEKLVCVREGSSKITERLVDKLELSDRVSGHLEHTLTSIKPSEGAVLLEFAREDGDPPIQVRARHVVLALPKSPLKKLASYFGDQIQKDLDAVFGFPLLKCFFLVNNPWWDDKTNPQTRASLMPTREVHYYYDPEKRQGLVMLYTDRPATEFWKIYVREEVHDRAEINGDQRLRNLFFKYLASDLQVEAKRYSAEALKAAAASDGFSDAEDLNEGLNFRASELVRATEVSLEVLAEDLAMRVVKFGIRDWSREPYGTAAHTWRPGAKSREVLGRLKAFSLPETEGDPRNVHICGEAYSDYHGFIEGALRSAAAVLDTIE